MPGTKAGEVPEPQRGELGFLHHWRRGLLGAVQSWARGCKQHVVNMIMSLIGAQHGFGIEDEIRQLLAGEVLKKAETDAYIVDRVAAALTTLKQCGTEQARQEYHIVARAGTLQWSRRRCHHHRRRMPSLTCRPRLMSRFGGVAGWEVAACESVYRNWVGLE